MNNEQEITDRLIDYHGPEFIAEELLLALLSVPKPAWHESGVAQLVQIGRNVKSAYERMVLEMNGGEEEDVA